MEINLTEEEFIDGVKLYELGLPWQTKESIVKMNEVLRKSDCVFEVGTGGSTIFFAKKCLSVTAIETNPDWFKTVKERIKEERLPVAYSLIEHEDDIVRKIMNCDIDHFNVVSVDTQGGFNRSRILNAFLSKGISKNLRMIVLDNYGHEGLFPDHYNKEEIIPNWETHTFDMERWAGNGTRLIIK